MLNLIQLSKLLNAQMGRKYNPTDPSTHETLEKMSRTFFTLAEKPSTGVTPSPPLDIFELQQMMQYRPTLHEWMHTLVGSLILPNHPVKIIQSQLGQNITIFSDPLPLVKAPPTLYHLYQEALAKALIGLAGHAMDITLLPSDQKFYRLGASHDVVMVASILKQAGIPIAADIKHLEDAFTVARGDEKNINTTALVQISETVLSEPIIQELLAGTQKALGKIPKETLSMMHDYLSARGIIYGEESIQRVINKFFTPEQLKTLKADLTAVVDVTQRNLQKPTRESILNSKLLQMNAKNTLSSTPWFIKLLAKFSKR
jgi:hypothetical protein